jgi:DNA-binding transcriptional LysR family regulator
MEIRQLQIFRSVARELSFTRAAEQARCVQSNVSVQIRALEQELGAQLFERLGQKVRLTVPGTRLLPYAERVLRLLDEAQTVTSAGENPSGTLVIGSPESVLTYRLPDVIRSFRAKFPAVELIFRSIGSNDLMTRLAQGELDLGLVIEDSLYNSRCHVEQLCPEPVVLLAEQRHPLVNLTRKISAEDLSTQTFLLTDVGCAYRAKLERALAEFNVRPNTIMEFTSVETIKRCATLGMGLACLPRIVVQQELADRKLVALPWRGPALIMNTLIAWHKDKWMSPALQSFVTLLRECLGTVG